MDQLGSMFDKEIRELKIANILFEDYKEKIVEDIKKSIGESKALLERAIMLSKADLLTDMVYEFTELQGVMGYYYALKQGEDENVALAIKEQYLPNSEDSELPTNLFTSLVAISTKLDTLMALFSIGKIPTGSKDPFGLRRAANGIIKIVIDKNLPFDISSFERFKKEYKDFDTKILEEFFVERLYQYFDVNPSLIKAVISSGERDLLKIAKKVEALKNIVLSSNFKDIFTTFKRVANIVKDINLDSELKVDSGLFEKDEERELFKEFIEVSNKKYSSYEEKLNALFGLRDKIDRFFDNVLVNVDDERVKNNRKNLIALIYKEFKDIADIKEISI
jgi:glycyl-tRNA synthetase beta chain